MSKGATIFYCSLAVILVLAVAITLLTKWLFGDIARCPDFVEWLLAILVGYVAAQISYLGWGPFFENFLHQIL